MNDLLIEQLKRMEGCRLIPYKDTRGFLTVGYGHLVTNGDTNPITQDEADDLFAEDLKTTMDHVDAAFPWLKNEAAATQGVVYNMAFNLGIGKLLLFKNFLVSVQASSMQQAAREMLSSAWKQQVPNRVYPLVVQLLLGEWQ